MQRGTDEDEFCDPDNPRTIDYETIMEAAEMTRPFISKTPVRLSNYHKIYASNLYYKLESRNRSGSCKDRGVMYALLKLDEEQRKKGVLMASRGNAAVAVAQIGERLGVPVTVIMPNGAPMTMLDRCYRSGAKVLIQGEDLVDTMRYGRAYAKEHGLLYLNGRDHPDVIAGYGSIALEILEQIPTLEALIIPVGMGGLAAGIAKVMRERKPKVLLYGVQPEVMPAFFKSLEKNELTSVPMETTMAERLAVTNAGVNAFHNVKDLLDKMILVEEKHMARAMLHLMEQEYIVSEAAGACPLGALMGNCCPELKVKNVVCIISGGNIDPLHFSRTLERGLSMKGRLIKLKVYINDSTAAQAKLLDMLYHGGYNVVQHRQNHRWLADDTYRMEFKLLLLAKDMEHALQLKQMIDKSVPIAEFETEPFNDKRMCPCFIKELRK